MAETLYVSGLHDGPNGNKCKMVYSYRGNEIVCHHPSHGADLVLFNARRNLDMDVEVYEIREHFARSASISVPTDVKTVQVGDKYFAPTQSGRAARGELEERARQVFKKILAAGPHGEVMIKTVGMQPSTIANAINSESPPSDGAIYAILKKWSDRGLADIEVKPFRLVGFTDRGKRELDI